ncbi:hypothetical protein Glove_69g46 [Diversispora epigaea]|uniref:Uncharacterized protein n=1 Tax=Diversispora epigaea TaxID=1348612 RepID=A0A397JGX4_9GLOM|nr:hypothetical protein Glove_69g46 [Diversispora epigaea]
MRLGSARFMRSFTPTASTTTASTTTVSTTTASTTTASTTTASTPTESTPTESTPTASTPTASTQSASFPIFKRKSQSSSLLDEANKKKQTTVRPMYNHHLGTKFWW